MIALLGLFTHSFLPPAPRITLCPQTGFPKSLEISVCFPPAGEHSSPLGANSVWQCEDVWHCLLHTLLEVWEEHTDLLLWLFPPLPSRPPWPLSRFLGVAFYGYSGRGGTALSHLPPDVGCSLVLRTGRHCSPVQSIELFYRLESCFREA